MSPRPDPPRRKRGPRLDLRVFALTLLLVSAAGSEAAPPGSAPNSRLAAENASPEVMKWRRSPPEKIRVEPAELPVGDAIPDEVEFKNEAAWIEPMSAIRHGDACDDNACNAWPNVHHPAGGTWVRAEYLLWVLDGADLPPLVTASPLGTAEADIGIFGGNSTILSGDDEAGHDARSGGRLTIGSWFDANRTSGWEASFAGFENGSETFQASSETQPNLARPYFDLTTSAEAAFLVAAEGTLSGAVNLSSENRLRFADVLCRQYLSSTASSRTDWLIGYRFGHFEDRLRIDQNSTFLVPQGPVIAGTTLSLFDLFKTKTQFHGGVFGVDHQRRSGPWTLSTLAKISLGGNRTEWTIDGETLANVPAGGSAVFVGGMLAQESNIGEYSESEFAVIPEFGLNLTGKLNRNVQFLVGYNLMYWSSVARAAEQIDRSLSQLPPEPIAGSGNPQRGLQAGGLFLHGLNTGLQIQF